MDDKERFIAALYPAARQVSQEMGMSYELILAQAAQETGWGQHQLPGTNNIFNIKAYGGWDGQTKTFNVWEMENGQKVWKDQPFRVYGSYEEALRDRVEFLRENSRYSKAGLFDEGIKGDLRREAEALQKGGYATDPNYADSLVRVFNSSTMQRAIRDAQLLDGIPAFAPELEGNSHARIGGFDPVNRNLAQRDPRARISPEANAQMLNPFADPRSPYHDLYAELKGRIPEASENRLAQMTAVCHMGGIKSGRLGDIHISKQWIVLRSDGPWPHVEVDSSVPAPPVQQTVQKVQAFDDQRTLQRQLDAQMAQQQSGPTMGGLGGHGRR